MTRSGKHRTQLRVGLGAEDRVPRQPIDPFPGRALAHVVAPAATDAAKPLVTKSLQVQERRPRIGAILQRGGTGVAQDEPRGGAGVAPSLAPGRVAQTPVHGKPLAARLWCIAGAVRRLAPGAPPPQVPKSQLPDIACG